MPFFGDLERFASELYPYRWPLTVGGLAVFAAVLAFAFRQGWHQTIWRHRLATALVAVPIIAVTLPVGWYTLSPLWTRTYLEETSPLDALAVNSGGGAVAPALGAPAGGLPPAGEESLPTPAPAFEPRATQRGEFSGADDFHFGRGTALLIETEPGRYTLRFEEFSVRNGPDLFVYLSPNMDGYAEGALNLGGLKATDGAFNYEVPPGTDVSAFESAIIWCRQFSVLFATAPLEPL